MLYDVAPTTGCQEMVMLSLPAAVAVTPVGGSAPTGEQWLNFERRRVDQRSLLFIYAGLEQGAD